MRGETASRRAAKTARHSGGWPPGACPDGAPLPRGRWVRLDGGGGRHSLWYGTRFFLRLWAAAASIVRARRVDLPFLERLSTIVDGVPVRLAIELPVWFRIGIAVQSIVVAGGWSDTPQEVAGEILAIPAQA